MMPASTPCTALAERDTPRTALAERDMAQIPFEQLVSACQRESLRFRREGVADGSFSLELVRRALAERDSRAWGAFVFLHGNCVMAAIRRHPAWLPGVEDDTYWRDRAFQRFWMAVGAGRAHQFDTLAALLAYLKMCAHSVVLDEIRARRPGRLMPLEEVGEPDLGYGDAVAEVIDELAAVELWRSVEDELHGEQERLIARLSWVGDMPPAEIYARHQTIFRDVADVYRLKRNLIDRLRRSPRLRAHLQAAA